MNKAFFLDRDGVINVEVSYLSDPDKVVIIPGVSEALKLLKQHGFKSIVVTNQSGVAQGRYSEADVLAVHRRIQELLALDGAQLDDFFYCLHHELYTGPCNCRKPAPGMLLEAAKKYDIDFSSSVMVGDRLSDIAAGRAAGCGKVYLVKTGYGSEVIRNSDVSDVPVADDLLDAVHQYLSDFEA